MDPLTNKSENVAPCFSSFLPLCLLALSLIIILGWQMSMGIQQYMATIRLADQQAVMANQASQTESKLQAMMTDLLQLSKTDPEAKAIVTKYRIKLNSDKPAPVPVQTALPPEKPTAATDSPAVSVPSPASPSVTN